MRHDLYYTINHWAPNESGSNETSNVQSAIQQFANRLPQYNNDSVYIHIDMTKCEKYPEDKPYFGGWELGRLLRWDDRTGISNYPSYIEFDIKLPDSWTFLTQIIYTGLFLRYSTAVTVKLSSSSLVKIDQLLSLSGSGSADPWERLNILDLRGCINLKEMHRLYMELENGKADKVLNIDEILYPTESLEDISNLFNFDINKVGPVSIRLWMILELFYVKWPKLKNISNFFRVYAPYLNTYINSRASIYIDNYPFPMGNYAYSNSSFVFDFSNMPRLENVTDFCTTAGVFQALSEVSIIGLGNDNKTIDIGRMFLGTSEDWQFNINIFSYKNCVIESSFSSYFFNKIKSFIHNGGPGIQGMPDGIPGIVTADITSYTWIYNRPSVYINTGDPALDNQIHQKIPNATVGIPAGWTHLFSRD